MPIINPNEPPSKSASFIKDYRRLARLVQSGAAFCAFDTETTGLNFKNDHVIEIGAVKFDKTGILSEYDSFIKIDGEIPPVITGITHITNEMIQDAPRASSVLDDFCNFAGNTILVAHNAQFDYNFVASELLRLEGQAPQNKIIDTLRLSRWAYPTFGKYSLQVLANALGINVLAAHRANDDARVCMELFLRILHDTDSIQKKDD